MNKILQRLTQLTRHLKNYTEICDEINMIQQQRDEIIMDAIREFPLDSSMPKVNL